MRNQDQKKLSVIIVTYNDAHHLRPCINSLFEKIPDDIVWEIIVVNNDEKQDMADLKKDYPILKTIEHGKNVGFGSAMNIGAKKAEGEVLLILNTDTKLMTDNIAQPLFELSKNEIGALGAGIIDEKNNHQAWSAGKELTLYDLVRNNLGISRSKDVWLSDQRTVCDWVAGTALFVRKDLFEKLGGFDENFFMYFEDMDLCKRIRQEGKQVVFFPQFKIFHKSGKSYSNKRLQKKHYYDSMEKYLFKYCSFFSQMVAKLFRKFIING